MTSLPIGFGTLDLESYGKLEKADVTQFEKGEIIHVTTKSEEGISLVLMNKTGTEEVYELTDDGYLLFGRDAAGEHQGYVIIVDGGKGIIQDAGIFHDPIEIDPIVK